MGVLKGKMGEEVVRCWPQQTRFYFSGSYVCANFGEDRSRLATVRVPTDGMTKTQTGFIIRPMLLAIAMSR